MASSAVTDQPMNESQAQDIPAPQGQPIPETNPETITVPHSITTPEGYVLTPLPG